MRKVGSGIRKAVTYVFMIPATVSWVGVGAVPWGIIPLLNPGVDSMRSRGGGVLLMPVVILGIVFAFVGAGVYYVVGSKVISFLRLWDEDLG